MRGVILTSSLLLLGYVVSSFTACGGETVGLDEGGADGPLGGSAGSGGDVDAGLASEPEGGFGGSSGSGSSGSGARGSVSGGSSGSTGSSGGASGAGGSSGATVGGTLGTGADGSMGYGHGGSFGYGTKGSTGAKGSRGSTGAKGARGSTGSPGRGIAGSPGSDSGSDSSHGYAFLDTAKVGRRHPIVLASGGLEAIPFAWHDAAGLPPPADMSIEAGGRPVLQVFTVGTRPFVRVGLDVVPIVKNAEYSVILGRADDSVRVTLVRGAGEVVLRAEVRAEDERTAANVVFPTAPWREALVTKY